MGKKNVTFADIAAYTGFSKTTISRYFNDPDSLTLANQKKIADALTALDYKENKLARSLASGKTEVVGIVVPNLKLHYYGSILDELLSTYEAYGYKFFVFPSNDREDIERRYFEELLAYNIEGLIVLSHTLPSEELKAMDIPVVTIEREDRCTCSVNTDNYSGALEATRRLVELDCDILIHFNTELDSTVPAHDRTRAFRDVCEEAGQAHEVILQEWGGRSTEYIQNLTPVFEGLEARYAGKTMGLFFANDTLANTYLNLILRKYGAFPDRYKLVGFDGSPISRNATVPFSTVEQQVTTIASEAMELLMMQMNERKKRVPRPLPEPIHKKISPVFRERETTMEK